MDPKLTEVAQMFDRFKAACARIPQRPRRLRHAPLAAQGPAHQIPQPSAVISADAQLCRGAQTCKGDL